MRVQSQPEAPLVVREAASAELEAGRRARPPADLAAHDMRSEILTRLLALIENEGAAGLLTEEEIRGHVDELIDDVRRSSPAAVTTAQWRQIRRQVIDELQGLGPLAPLMADPAVSDILVNGPHEVWIDKAGRLEPASVGFDDERHLRRLVDRLVANQGRQLDASLPYVDTKLDDGSRLHAIVPPLSAKGTIVSIRRFRPRPLTEEELVAAGVLSPSMLELLRAAVAGRCNIVIAGGAAAGKTTLLNFLSRYIPADERIVTVEETAELRLEHAHVVTLEARSPNVEGRGGVGLRELIRNALRMRADRIVVGEVRGEEALDMLQAMNVGHDGSVTTVHASGAEEVLHRLESLALMGGANIPRDVVRSMIASAIDLVVYVARFREGRRVVTDICEVQRVEGEVTTRQLFGFERLADAPGSERAGRHVLVRQPLFTARLAARGHAVPEHLLPLPGEGMP